MRPDEPGSPLRVVLFGVSVHVSNLGVRALGNALVRLIREAAPDARIALLYGNRSGGAERIAYSEREAWVEVVNFRLSPRARLREHLVWILLLALLYRLSPLPAVRAWVTRSNRWLATIAKADLVGEINAGDSFSDIYGLRRFLVLLLPSLTALLLGKSPVLLPQTYGPYRAWYAKRLARFILRRAAGVYARDRRSLRVARVLLGGASAPRQPVFCPDVAFMLHAPTPDLSRVEPLLTKNPAECLVGLNVSGLLYMGGYTGRNMFDLKCDYPELVRRLIERLLERPAVRLLLVPHLFGMGLESDEPVCRRIFAELPEAARARVHLVSRPCDERQIKGLIGLCDFFIGSRMHACIAALSQGIPAVGLAYSRKFVGVFDSLGVGSLVIDARALAPAQAIALCLDRLDERELLAVWLKLCLPQVTARIHECFGEIINEVNRLEPSANPFREGYANVAAEN